ncbi:anti-sigma factor family protein [Cronobacter dublinensis]
MKSATFTPPWSDEAIVAWLDGEMNDADAQRFQAQMAQDAALAGRVAELSVNTDAIRQAFAPLLDDAPLSRMQQRLEAVTAPAPRQPRASGVSRRALIAASVGFLTLGAGFGYWLGPAATLPDGSEKIRDLEAQYMSLYSAETLLDADTSPAALARGLQRAAQDLSLPVQAAQLMLQDAELKMVRMLRYDAQPIAQIAWLHAQYGPMALCISREDKPGDMALASERRHGMNLVWWRRHGYQFVFIGRNPAALLEKTARQFTHLLAPPR